MHFTKKDHTKYGFAKYSLPDSQPINYNIDDSRSNSITSDKHSLRSNSMVFSKKNSRNNSRSNSLRMDAFNNDNSINRYSKVNTQVGSPYKPRTNSISNSSVRYNSVKSNSIKNSSLLNNTRYNSLTNHKTNSLNNYNLKSNNTNGNMRTNSILSTSKLKAPSTAYKPASSISSRNNSMNIMSMNMNTDENIKSIKTIQIQDDFGNIKSITTETIKRVNGMNIIETKMEKVDNELQDFDGCFVDAVEEVKVRFNENLDNYDYTYEDFDENLNKDMNDVSSQDSNKELDGELYQDAPDSTTSGQFNINIHEHYPTKVNKTSNSNSNGYLKGYIPTSPLRYAHDNIPEENDNDNEPEVDEETAKRNHDLKMYNAAYKVAHDRVYNKGANNGDSTGTLDGIDTSHVTIGSFKRKKWWRWFR